MDAFSIKIFFPDGITDGFRTVEIDDWSGQGIVCPKSLFQKKREEFQKVGVYVLIGDSEKTDREKIYIGISENVFDRLDKHYVEKDFWQKVILFTGNNLTYTHAKFLESRLITLAKQSKQCELDNIDSSNEPTIGPGDRTYGKVFAGSVQVFFCDWYPIL